MLLLDLLIPARCAGCGARGAPCCARCAGVWGSVSEVVRVPVTGVARVFALARYRGVARRLLIAYKERGRRDLANSLGRALAEALVVLPLRKTPGLSEARDRPPARPAHPFAGVRESAWAPAVRSICLVPAPSRRSAARVRGGPHVERLAAAAASVLAERGFEVAVAPALELTGGARDAVGLDRAERVANLAGRLRFREAGRPPPGFPVVVLDDVITTGATAAACVRALAGEGIEVAAVLTLLAAG
ncbi:ComF family protein [Amycolatopsis sp. RTGN1]|uniref:ComF family protein n=1 Tax=Amycolatopsis ponsaeliensis TaxID=2992142 RepID=UPI0025503953|nr:ComF family protein [Amycolatopsis sp. RTGN1]